MLSRTLVASATAVVATLAPSAAALASTPTAAANPAPASAGKGATCDPDAHWPAYVQGRPDGFDPHDDGVFIWHNPHGGWGLRVSHPALPGKANKVVFTGTISSKGTIGNVARVKDEKDDVVKVGPKGHTLYFRFVNYGGVDGVDFTTTCTPGLAVALKADGSSMQTKFIHLGDKDAKPGSNPFLIRRRDADTGTAVPRPAPGKTTSTAPTAA